MNLSVTGEFVPEDRSNLCVTGVSAGFVPAELNEK